MEDQKCYEGKRIQADEKISTNQEKLKTWQK